MISLDPYLQDWDERFHALVAKHMMDNPFRPMLRLDPIIPYDPAAWCCNHIWVHKPPLFLWQMALSMKIFGVNEFFLRLPSAIMGALNVFFVFGIVKMWMKERRVAFVASIITAFSFYQLELTTGRFSVDHNDVATVFYITGSIWAFLKYVNRQNSLKWALIVGLFAGCAVLNKWLTGMMVFGAWGTMLLLKQELRNDIREYLKLLFAITIACVVFLPWQLYITYAFPIETSITHDHHWLHITDVLGGHVGDHLFHVRFLQTAYGKFLLPFMALGFIGTLTYYRISKPLSNSLLILVLIVFGFFSLIVKTKMLAFPYPVSAILIAWISLGLIMVFDVLVELMKINHWRNVVFSFLCLVVAVYSLKPWNIAEHRYASNVVRNSEMHNARIYRSLPPEITENYNIINVKEFEDVELMFYQNANSFHWYPPAHVLDSLKSLGHRFAAFASHGKQQLPEYIINDPDVAIIQQELK